MKLRNILIAAAGLAVAAASADAASAMTRWQHNHPLRVEVNHRAQHLNRSITQEYRSGKLTLGQARLDRARLRSVTRQERYVAAHHGSHIGFVEQNRLNREENAIRHRIHNG